ncbi:hypothetical protein Q5P01_000048 [Channa striata]|uniref:Uncharacterized protein n=1 Tax=Channa striata TaxID=64152 RepID=A0AA88IFZ4_CHASR|nr:hypothetical protein Q5P01_000048 [Channa striata]
MRGKGGSVAAELAPARGRRGVPSGTFNTMKLRSPAVEFRNSKARVCARSVADHRWYAVQGITKTLDSIAGSRKRAHNMICMDLFARILTRPERQPGTSLRWLLECVVNLNAPESKAARFQGSATEAAQCKDVFNGKKSARRVGPVSRVILTQLQALHLSPICARLKVAGVPTPDRSGGGGGATYHSNGRDPFELGSGTAGGEAERRGPGDLCFRNMMFNQEKARVPAAVAERKSVEN